MDLLLYGGNSIELCLGWSDPAPLHPLSLTLHRRVPVPHLDVPMPLLETVHHCVSLIKLLLNEGAELGDTGQARVGVVLDDLFVRHDE